MKKIFVAILVNLLLVSFSFAAGGTANEAKALMVKAAAFVKAEGKEKAFAEFTKPKGKFVDRDLYIFAVDFNGITLAHGGNAKLADLIKRTDTAGIELANDLIDKLFSSPEVSAEYNLFVGGAFIDNYLAASCVYAPDQAAFKAYAGGILVVLALLGGLFIYYETSYALTAYIEYFIHIGRSLS